MKNVCMLLVAAGVCVGASGAARAGVVFEQLPDYRTAWFSDSSSKFVQRMAENFTLDTDASIGTITAWGAYLDDNVVSDHFTVFIYADAGGVPGGILYSGVPAVTSTIDTGVNFGWNAFRTTLTLDTPFNAVGGVKYWVSLDNATNNGGAWAWITTSESDGVFASSLNQGENWNAMSGDSLSLRLSDVPAPSGLALLGLGGLVAGRRRR
ncbi:MAG: PEP-CTERM sorting domain-containing protein [Phycisphaerales bacterium]|nr:PEP-CTERM sorting domain-containing protein [Phycisphaerales bacterium]